MLIICSGPDTFLARQKARDLVAAYLQKHDPSGTSLEHLEHQTSLADALSKLSNLGLFASKKFLKYENLLSGINITQSKQLSKALVADANQTIIMTYEDKIPTAKILDIFPKDFLFIYKFDELKGQELNQWIANRYRFYGVPLTVAPKLIELHENDLWAIETSLQIVQALGNLEQLGQTFESENNVFAVIDDYLKQNQNWRAEAIKLDPYEMLSPLVSQLINWHRIKAGESEGIHPFVQKKLSSVILSDPEDKTLKVLRAFYASRSSLAQNQEIIQIF